MTLSWVAISVLTVAVAGNESAYQTSGTESPNTSLAQISPYASPSDARTHSRVMRPASFSYSGAGIESIPDENLRRTVRGMLPASILENGDITVGVKITQNQDGTWTIKLTAVNGGTITWVFADMVFLFGPVNLISITGTDPNGNPIPPSECFALGCFIAGFDPGEMFSVTATVDGVVAGDNPCSYTANVNDGSGPTPDSSGDCSFDGGSVTAQHSQIPTSPGASDVHQTFDYAFENTMASPVNITLGVDIVHTQSFTDFGVMGPAGLSCGVTEDASHSSAFCTYQVPANSGFPDNTVTYWYTPVGAGGTDTEAWFQISSGPRTVIESYHHDYQEFADFELSKTQQSGIPTEGTPYTYGLQIRQLGPSTARNVVVDDDLPDGYTFTSFTGDGTIEQTGNVLSWLPPDLPGNQTASIEYTGSYDAIYPCSLSTRSNSADVLYTNGVDVNPLNNSVVVDTELCPYSATGFACIDENDDDECSNTEPLWNGILDFFVDFDEDGFFNMTADQEVQTDPMGQFSVPNLGPGNFSIRVKPGQDAVQTIPFSLMISTASVTDVRIPVSAPPPVSTPGSIHVQKFFDLDGDGIFDANEDGLNDVTIELRQNGTVIAQQTTMDRELDGMTGIDSHSERGWVWFESVPPGTYTLSEEVPPGMKITTPSSNLIEVVLSSGGRSEGHLFGNTSDNLDFGDAWTGTNSSYPTLLADNGARHKIRPDFFLGDLVDAEPDGQLDILAGLQFGDDNNSVDDEDGIGVGLASLRGVNRTRIYRRQRFVVGTTAVICAKSSMNGTLDGWVDWDGDNSWSQAGDHVIVAKEVKPIGFGIGSCFDVVVPNVDLTSRSGITYSRFRLTETGISTPEGFASEGEVEDYLVTLADVNSINSADDNGDANIGDGFCENAQGLCTFRAFLEEANSTPDLDAAARFIGIGKAGAVTLQPQSPYPAITSSVVILGGGEVDIDGSQAGAGAIGFDIQTDAVQIEGVAIHGFDGPAVQIAGDNNALADLTIRDNSGVGVSVLSGIGNSIRTSAIFNNGGLGIDLSADGITFNDGDDSDIGTNKLQNYPELISATAENGHIMGSFSSTPDVTFDIDFFSSPACDASGNGQGQIFLGTSRITTDNLGSADIDINVEANSFTIGESITATATDPEGNTSEFSACLAAITTSIERNEEAEIPQDFVLHQNYPNPFNPVTNITFGLSRAEFVTIEVFDLLGKRVELLASEWKEPGEYTISFDASNLPSGLYLYRMQAGGFTSSKQLTLLK